MPKVTVQRLDGDAALEVVNDVVIGDVGDGGSCVEEALDVGPDRVSLAPTSTWIECVE
jgi:hypothetical protein